MSVPSPTSVGRYQLHERLGQGTTGVVYVASDPHDNRHVAVKMMLPDVAKEAGTRQHFLREARAIARLRHRHIAAIYEVSADEDSPFIAMELLRGSTLAARLATSPPLTLAESLEIADQLCVGLQFAHEHGIVHRNVSPANIWLLDDGSVKLLDFGLPPTAAGTVTDRRALVGRVAYMAPEQLAAKPLDGHADIFSAGVVLFELVTGRRPFEADSITGIFDKVVNTPAPPLTNVPARVAAPLQAILARALEKDPARRYPDPLEMAADLTIARLALVEVPQAEPQTVPVPVPPRSGGHARPLAEVETRPVRQPESFAEHDVFRAPPPPIEIDVVVEPASPASADDHVLHHRPALAPPSGARRAASSTGIGSNRGTWALGGIAVALAIGIGVWMGRRPTPPSQTNPSSSQDGGATGSSGQVVEVRIETDPVDAELFVNGTALGMRTPATVTADRLKGAELRVEKGGYQAATVRVKPQDLADRRISIRLTPELASILVSGSAAFPFEVSGVRGIVSPRATTHRFTIQGDQTLRIRAPEFFLDRPVAVTSAKGTVTLFVPALGRLSVGVTPALERCKVSIAGRDFGTPPYPPVPYQSIVAGTHRVQLTCPDGSIKQQPVIVEASRDRSIVFR